MDMAVTLEQVERLREKADISYEEARAVLEQCGGDLLEALILLERQGRTRAPGGGGFFTTQPGGGTAGVTDLVLTEPPPGQKKARREGSGFWAQLRELLYAGLNLLRHSLSNQFEVWRHGELMTSLPVLILIILVIVAFWITIPLVIVGHFFGCQYRFSGPDLNQERVNEVMDKVSHTVGDVVDQVKEEFRKQADKEKNKKS